jgi:hypothetical protein
MPKLHAVLNAVFLILFGLPSAAEADIYRCRANEAYQVEDGRLVTARDAADLIKLTQYVLDGESSSYMRWGRPWRHCFRASMAGYSKRTCWAPLDNAGPGRKFYRAHTTLDQAYSVYEDSVYGGAGGHL